MTVRTMHRPWSELSESYEKSATYREEWSLSHLALAKLCRAIGNSDMQDGLFGHKSHHTLRIAQQPTNYPPHPSIQWLSIKPDAKSNKIEFRFEDTRRIADQWTRIENPERTLERFNSFLRQVGWAYSPILEDGF